MNAFLPCCPYDCQTLTDSDILIDEFLQMETALSDGENEMSLSTGDIGDKEPKILDYVLTPSHHVESAFDDCQKFSFEETLGRSILALSNSSPTGLEEANSEIHVIITNSEDPSGLSSVSKAPDTSIFEGSDGVETFHHSNNVESFQDLNSFLNKDYISSDSGAPEEILNLTSNEDSPVSGCPLVSEFSSSPAVSDENDCHEPPSKIAKLGDCSNTSKNDKYYEMRKKNNISSRRSRHSKKQREKELEEREKHLIKENESLRKREEELERLVKKVKDILFSSVKKKT